MLRTEIGEALGNGGPLHECVGFKGQGLVFDASGYVDVDGSPPLGGRTQMTAQAFVKPLVAAGAANLALIEAGASATSDTQVFKVSLTPAGAITVSLSTLRGSTPREMTVTSSANAVQFGHDLFTQRSGWRHIAFVYDGNAPSVEAQVLKPILSGQEMWPQSIQQVLSRLSSDSVMLSQFTSVFGGPNPVTKSNLTTALSMYVRSLTVESSAADQGLDPASAAGRGEALFFGRAGCFSCHRGPSFTDDDFHNVLTVKTSETIRGRIDATGRPEDLGRIKTPTLRNIALTKPYFHDGSKAELTDLIDHYSRPFLATNVQGVADLELRTLFLTAGEKADLLGYLQSLTSAQHPTH